MMLRVLVLLLAVARPASAFHVCQAISDATPVAPAVQVTSEKAAKARAKVLEAIAKGHTIPPGQVKKLTEEYGQEIRWTCSNDPDQCAALLMGKGERTAAGAAGGNVACVPEQVTLDGQIAMAIAYESTGPVEQWFLLPADGTHAIRLAVAREKGRPRAGRAKVTGHRLVNDMYVAAEGDQVVTVQAAAGGPDIPPPGPARVVDVAATFTDSPSNLTDAALAEDSAYLARYYSETTFRRFALSIRNARVTIPTTNPCDPFTAAQAVIDQLGTSIDWRAIDIIAVNTAATSCPFGGVSNVGINGWLRLPDGTGKAFGVNLNRDRNARYVKIHELGHALGLSHAGEYLDLASPFPVGDDAAPGGVSTFGEYLNGWSVMGTEVGPFGCHGAGALGFLTPGEWIANPPPGTYTIRPWSTPGTVRCLVWAYGQTMAVAVQYRTGILDPWETTVGEPFGVYVTTSGRWGGRDDIRRVVGRPDARWVLGERITTPSGLDMTLVAFGPDSATIRVDATGTPDTQPPTITVQAPAAGQGVAGTITMRGATTDNRGVAAMQCSVLDAAGVRRPCAVTGTTTWDGTLDTTALADGRARISLAAFDPVGNIGGQEVAILVSNGAPIPDSCGVAVTSKPGSPASIADDYQVCAACIYNGGTPTPCAAVGLQAQWQTVSHAAYSRPVDGQLECRHFGPDQLTAGTANVIVSGACRKPDGTTLAGGTAIVWSQVWTDPSVTTTTVPTTTTTSTSTTATTRPPTTTTSSTTTSSSTTRPTTTTSTTTRPPTTSTTRPACVAYGVRCELGGTPCCDGLVCRRKGGRRRCLP